MHSRVLGVGTASILLLASCSLALPVAELSDAIDDGSVSDGAGSKGDGQSLDARGQGSEDAMASDGTPASDAAGDGTPVSDATLDAGGSYCDKLRASPSAATLRFCRDFDDGVIGELVGTASAPRAIDSTSFLSPPNSVAFTRPSGKVGSHIDTFERGALATVPHRADYSVALRASVPNSDSGFVIRLTYGSYTLTYNVYGVNGSVIDHDGFHDLSAVPFINQWGTFRFLVDFDAKTFRVYVNGVDAFGVAYPLPMPASPPVGLLFRVDLFGNDAASRANWDNMSIFAE